MTELTFHKATKHQSKARIAIDGPSGSGKTYTALTAATALAAGSRIAVIDTERGSASLYSDTFTFDVLELDSFSPETYTEAIHAAERGGYAVIVIDSLSHAWDGEGGALDLADNAAKRQKTPNSFTAWKEVTPLHRRMVDALLGSPVHIIATMRSKMEYVQEKDSTGRTVIRKIGLAPVQRAGIEYEFTLVGDMDLEHNLVITKSRCPALADAVEHKPSMDFFIKFYSWLNDGLEPPSVQTPTPFISGSPLQPQSPTPSHVKSPINPFPQSETSANLPHVPEPQPVPSEMTLEEANAVTNSRGVPYGEIDSNILKFMSGNLYKALKDPLNSSDQIAEYNCKLQAIDTILKNRNK